MSLSLRMLKIERFLNSVILNAENAVLPVIHYILHYALAAEEISGCYYICNYALASYLIIFLNTYQDQRPKNLCNDSTSGVCIH
uniref:Uncharacterized protein n=2 Tax=Picea TaxID=3328 RepID=A0A101M505_PICGL|nr:hypothetical protein ABT39_MTgene1037 [Picea glauca]QHR90038.1 hypothetical protein Q903MT_gene4061 [Picea sitchensis]